uniref:NADH-ubiquinone oxidoreductase chain 4L n=1 Tax=Aneurus sublobatus TaxID=1176473 RepID=A0A172DYT6_9HEMI|nr:NADH dehydrogenase subunit 4L [Aneurus sublobatus]AFI54689.1 NADH dehydrogenase subunit 4L [Aneurus sublobatus]
MVFFKLLKLINLDFLIYLFVIGIYSFSSNRSQFLMVLFCLEFLVLVLYLVWGVYLSLYNYDNFFLLFFLVFSVSEAVLGLGILVSVVRSFGNDYINSLNFLW